MSACAIVMSAWLERDAGAGDAVAAVAACLRTKLADLAPVRRIVACSGGLDSSVLLVVLARWHALEGWPPPRALHVDHGLQRDSVSWAAATEALCRSLDVACDVHRLEVERTDAGLEADARRARYAAFAAQVADGSTLLLAHHRDDQAETLLLRLLRGSGPAGLAAMPARRRLGSGWLQRPLLDLDRRVLLAAADELKLEVCEDPSNASLEQDRNYLRHAILPLLERRWPGYRQTLARAAALCGEQKAALAILLGPAPAELPVNSLDGPLEVAAVRLRNWLAAAGVPAPSRRRLAEILRQKDARADAGVCVELGPWQVRRFAGALFVVPVARPEPPAGAMTWRPPEPLVMAHGCLAAEPVAGAGLKQVAGPIEVRFRCGGERLRPAGRVGSRTLKDLFQEAAVPSWERAGVPLIFVAGELVAIAGLYVAAGWQAAPDEAGWRLIWTPSEP
ncbi:MAG: tRNA lysidine(34) synthetase TilS [Gammaproteobacteria bacterium]|nr:MAG: tRNA lysidine(34) synthetase TilS [Gammaproteobacteria bacterium]